MKIAVIIGLLLVVAAILVLARLALKRQEINSFWDVVRNPDAMPDLDQFHKEVDDAAESLTGSPEEIAKLVDYYVFDVKSSQDGWTELRILDKLGSEAYPRAIEILDDPSLRDKLTVLTKGEYGLPEAPINRLCTIFEQDTPPPPEAAALLSPFLESQSKEIRKSVALTLGAIASIHSLPDLRKALADKDRDVCGYTLMGILRAIEGGRIEPSSKDDFFALVANTWPG